MLTACRASQRLGRRRGTHPSPCPTTALSTNIVGPRAEEALIGLSLKVISSFPDCEVYNMIRYCQMSRTHNVRCRVGPVCVRGTIMLPALLFAPRASVRDGSASRIGSLREGAVLSSHNG